MELYEQRSVHSPGHLFLSSTDWSVALLALGPSRLRRQICANQLLMLGIMADPTVSSNWNRLPPVINCVTLAIQHDKISH